MAKRGYMDKPRAVSTQPAAAKVLVALLEKLHTASVRGRRGGLAVVRTMTENGLPKVGGRDSGLGTAPG